ncbi:MAG: beta-ketoacyl-[acyl-carrier-protein] synthase family protein [Proteobacteria bacterium]|nr:beta-ketoacyl-[acyl-carrier-protein] synthase family protein [Pseudomonadota bacterium]
MLDHKNRRRVVVTGIGAVTPAGNSLNATWQSILDGRSNAGYTTLFDASEMPSKISYEVQNFEAASELMDASQEAYSVRATHLALTAADEALTQASLKSLSANDKDRFGVCLGVGVSSHDFKWFSDVFVQREYGDERVKFHSRCFPQTLTAIVAEFAGALGGCFTIHTACASSGQSMGEAFDLIARGHLDCILTGGADSMINPLHMAGFNLLGALATGHADPKTASRPFDMKRNGFVMGEGACVLIFEALDHALARNATILAEVCGYGVTESAYRITDLHPEGEGPIEAMQMALDDAGIGCEDVQYLNAHGTSTRLNDMVESLAISKVFPKPQSPVKVSSTKSVTGHLISAAGALELAVCIKALEQQTLPPSSNLSDKDPDCVVELTDSRPLVCKMQYALSNSIGFGGSNTAIIVGGWKHV